MSGAEGSICNLPKLWLTGERVVGDSSAGDPETKGFNLIIDTQVFLELLTK